MEFSRKCGERVGWWGVVGESGGGDGVARCGIKNAAPA